MKYKIDTNTPLIPIGGGADSKHSGNRLSIAETLLAMPVSFTSSFLVPWKKQKPEHVRGTICGAISSVRLKFPERKFATRRVDKEKGIRVWRLQ